MQTNVNLSTLTPAQRYDGETCTASLHILSASHPIPPYKASTTTYYGLQNAVLFLIPLAP